jgi:hypothetical protein
MAKKGKKGPSPAEVQRRERQRQASAQIKGNNSWDDCHQLNAQCVDLLQQAGAIDLVLRQEGVYAAVSDKAVLNENIRLLARDTTALTQKLGQIYEQHKHKSGSCRTPDDFALSLQVYEQYIQFMEAYRLTCQPVLNHLLEQTAEAEAKLQRVAREISAEEATKLAAQDPNHNEPIDVEVKMVPTERTVLHVQVGEGEDPQAAIEHAVAEHKVA